jgi:hypothetical protein
MSHDVHTAMSDEGVYQSLIVFFCGLRSRELYIPVVVVTSRKEEKQRTRVGDVRMRVQCIFGHLFAISYNFARICVFSQNKNQWLVDLVADARGSCMLCAQHAVGSSPKLRRKSKREGRQI